MKTSDVSVPAKRKASTDSEADDMTSPGQSAKPRKRVPAEIWETKRPIITRLYQEEKKSLKEVMEIMEREYHFTATVKMYKSRIWKWGLDKKLKGDEVLAIMLLKRDRDELGKGPTEFRIRGQLVDMENINRYLKRNPSLMAKFRAGHTPSVQTTLEVTCRTPSPPSSPPRALAPTTELQSTEQVLCLFRDYIDGSFASGDWWYEYDVGCSSKRVEGIDSANSLFERVIASFALVNQCMKKRDHIDINRVLGPAFDALRGLVASETPDFVARTVCLLWYLERHYKQDLLRVVLNYLAGLIPIMLGPYHILGHIWRRLAATNFSSWYELSMRLYAMLVPKIEEQVGSANYLTHLVYCDYVDCMLGRQNPEECEVLLSRHLARAEASGQQHPWLADMALSHAAVLATCKENQGRRDEAINVLTSHLNAYDMSDDQKAGLHLTLGVKYHGNGNMAASITSFKMAARIALTSDLDERVSNAALANLEKVFRETGKPEKAHRVHEYRMNRVAVFAKESNTISRGLSDDYEGDSDVSIELETLPEWLWKVDETEEDASEWPELAPFGWVEKSSPASYPGCVDGSLHWTNTSQSESPAILSTEYSPRLDNHVIDPQVEYYYGHEGEVR
ncbi:hypothetical protein CkaCkLH20_11664 [Colletotrichum karsti]|uniref:Clr5 domain-containing protein n=1 Tax=Colletotrichum karsti TaxID=1095194 RepID=A0A9P6LFN7_9PEZI|nr:uncharacterized protein CkaCkLH20_11664 [Colletotrichum karsti]KAF9870765.1 hypothetical protein CkaCkLH20_11664 [Colletotrichum karsti]